MKVFSYRRAQTPTHPTSLTCQCISST